MVIRYVLWRKHMQMFCLQVADVLKRFAVKVTTPSVKERVTICENVASCVSREGSWLQFVYCT